MIMATKILHWEVFNMTPFNKVASTTASGEDDCELRTDHPSTLILATCWHAFRNQSGEALLESSDIKAWPLSQWCRQDTQSGRLLRTQAAHQIIPSPTESSDVCNLFWNA